MYSGRVPAGAETNGLLAVPTYLPQINFNFNPGLGNHTLVGQFTLSPGTPGFDIGAIIPNFNDNYVGTAPDMGAHETGTSPMEFGMDAYND